MSGAPAAWLVAALAGAGFGMVYLGLVWASARVLIGGGSVALFLALAGARAALVLGTLWAAFALGASAATAVAALAGFVLIRVAVTRWQRGTGNDNGSTTWR